MWVLLRATTTVAVAAVLCLSGAAPSRADTVIGPFAYNVNGNLYPPTSRFFGAVGTGQTFTVGADNVLESFSFAQFRSVSGGPNVYDFTVMAWDDDNRTAVGPALASQQNLVVNDSSGAANFANLHLSLTTGGKYVAFVQVRPAVPDARDILLYSLDKFAPYAGGEHVTLARDGKWSSSGNVYDMAFTATFTRAAVVPLPSAAFGGLTLLGGFVLLRVRRRDGARPA